MRSVLNDTHFVLCYDRLHNYLIVLILANKVDFRNFEEVFQNQYWRSISPVYQYFHDYNENKLRN